MNKTHRIVWSDSRQQYIVASENVAACGKPASTRLAVAGAVAAALLAMGGNALAAPCSSFQLVAAETCDMSNSATLTNAAANGSPIRVGSSSLVGGITVTSIVNTGVLEQTNAGMGYGIGITNSARVDTIDNQGTIRSLHYGIIALNALTSVTGTVGSITNSGTIYAGDWAISTMVNPETSVINTGTIHQTGSYSGGAIQYFTQGGITGGSATAGSITNSGLIQALGDALWNGNAQTISVSNSSTGTIIGGIVDGSKFNVSNDGLFALQSGSSVAGTITAGSYKYGSMIGTFTQSSTGTLRMGINTIVPSTPARSAYSKLTVTGAATLSGKLFIDVATAADKIENAGTKLAGFVSASGGLTVTNLVLEDNSAVLDFGYSLTATALDLCITAQGTVLADGTCAQTASTSSAAGLHAADVGITGARHAMGAAVVLDKLIPAWTAAGAPNSAGVNTIFTRINALTGYSSVQEVSRAVVQLLPRTTETTAAAGNALAAINRVVQARVDGNRGMSSGDGFYGDKHLWVKPFTSGAKQDDQNGMSGYSSHIDGVAFGLDGTLSRNTRLGVGLAYAVANVDGNAQISSSKVDVYQLIGYGSHDLDANTDLSYQVDVGNSSNTSRRNIAFLNETASAHYDTLNFHAGAGVGRSYALSPSTRFVPSVRLDYTMMRDPRFTETGSNANLTVSERTSETLVLGIDGKIAHQLNASTTVQAILGVSQETLGQATSVSAAFAGSPGLTFTTPGIEADKTSWRAGLGISSQQAKGMEISGRYDMEQRAGYTNQSIAANLRWSF